MQTPINAKTIFQIKTNFMSKIIRLIFLMMLICMPAATILAQINSMNKPKNPQAKADQSNPTIQSGQQGSQTMQNKQTSQSATSNKNLTGMGAKAMMNTPIPKRVLFLTRKPKLALQQQKYTKVLPLRYPQTKSKQYGVAATGSVGKAEQSVRFNNTDAKQKGIQATSSVGSQDYAVESVLLGLATKNYQ